MNGMNKITVEEAEQLLIEIFQKYTNIDFKKKKNYELKVFSLQELTYQLGMLF